ncbi:hypothetical protein [Pseudoalteromonas mariniglutinosa]|uniref:hypothetical protein n=1 Tax=Pseudoalteromonas mariniglutinosa TaxID=206042 RepID=UPI00384DC92D
MLIDYFIKKPNNNVARLSRRIDTLNSLKQQHHQAFNYRLKRFAVTKVGIASAFSAGVGYQALQGNNKHESKVSYLSHLIWLLKRL